jgi:predicted PurR-regulated permease PerM
VIDPADAVPRWLLPRGLIVVLGMTGLLVSVLALQQFASILAPVLLALVLVIGVHPLTGILRRRGVPLWLAVTITLIAVRADRGGHRHRLPLARRGAATAPVGASGLHHA